MFSKSHTQICYCTGFSFDYGKYLTRRIRTGRCLPQHLLSYSFFILILCFWEGSNPGGLILPIPPFAPINLTKPCLETKHTFIQWLFHGRRLQSLRKRNRSQLRSQSWGQFLCFVTFWKFSKRVLTVGIRLLFLVRSCGLSASSSPPPRGSALASVEPTLPSNMTRDCLSRASWRYSALSPSSVWF